MNLDGIIINWCIAFLQVNISLYRNLQEMGYHPILIVPALKRANNDINAALQMIADNFFISSVIESYKPTVTAGPSTAPAPGRSNSNSAITPNDGQVPGPSSAPIIPIPGVTASMQRIADQVMAMEHKEEPISAEDRLRSQKAYDALTTGMCSDSEYIDLALSAETTYLEQYKNLLHI